MDTIFAQASALGKAGVAVLRISGSRAVAGAEMLCGALPPARQAGLRVIRSAAGAVLDTALVLHFRQGASFTGEDVVELHLHGSVAVIRAVLAELSAIPELRAAEAGEFTRRALDNQRLDLTQVEGLADLIDAETELQRQQAQDVLSGALSDKVETWRKLLIEAAALLEASLDFSDEEVPVDIGPDVEARLGAVADELERELGSWSAAERIRDGFEVAIIGRPNSGKSTLLNAIARRPVALTSEIAGTTRDVIEVRLDLNGLPVTMLDTAGLRQTADPLEAAGIDLARRRATEADLRVWLTLEEGDAPENADLVRVAKDDTGAQGGVSGVTGYGLPALLGEIERILLDRVPRSRLLIRERHRTAIGLAHVRLGEAREMMAEGGEPELIADALRQSFAALAELIGGIDVDDLLDDIFSRFCIGK